MIQEQARGWDSVSEYVRTLVRRDATRLHVYPPPRPANDLFRRQLPMSTRCNDHANIVRGKSLTVTLNDGSRQQW
jgi:hypothetical protein